MKHFYILLILLFGFSIHCFSQATFSFTIADQKTKAPIPFCYVIVKGKNVSALSNESGKAELKISDPDTLVVYQLGYVLHKTTKETIIKNNLTVYLISKNINLEEVIVNSKNRDTFMNKNDVVFLDFDFYDDHILTLAGKGGKFNTLMLLDQNGNKITERKLSIETETIFKDCFDNLHLLTKDSIYQVYYNYQDLVLLPPFHIRNYYGLLKPCECNHFNTYIFKQKQYRGLKNVYYLFDGQVKPEKNILAIVADSTTIKGFNMDYNIQYFLDLRRKGFGYATSVTELNKHIDELREDVPLPPDYLLLPVESEMKKLDTNFVLFDHTNKWVQTFSLDGKPISKFPFKNDYNVNPKLFIDHDLHQYIFSSLSKSGILTLYKYDPVKNTFTHKFELSSFYYIKNFKPKGNNLYFIYKDRLKSNTKTKILKQYIQWEKI